MRIEWPTLTLIGVCYALWVVILFWMPGLFSGAWILLVPVIVLQASLQHEVLHGHPFGHPFRNRALAEPLVIASLNLAIPYIRFRDTHLAHHTDATLTDPYDDPESNYLDPAVWKRLPWLFRRVLQANNTLMGRMLLGPALGQVTFMRSDWQLIRAGDIAVARAWSVHILVSVPVVVLVIASPTPMWAYVAACYGALSLLKIRTFLEHQAHARARGRTVIIEDCGPLAFLFLNNNLHVVHHMHPRVAWYRLPQIYAANREQYLARNDAYLYTSYAQIFRQHFVRAKDPVAHPLYVDK